MTRSARAGIPRDRNAVRRARRRVAVTGLASIHKANILHTLLSAMSKKALFIAGDEAEATRMLEDLNAMGVTSAFYPLRDFSLRDTEGSSHEYERQRIEALTLLQTGQCTCIVTTIDAALQYVLPPKKLKERTVKLSAGQEISVDEIVRALVRCGYVRADQIDGTGQFCAPRRHCGLLLPRRKSTGACGILGRRDRHHLVF